MSITKQIGNSKVVIGNYTYGSENLNIKQWNEGSSLTIGNFCSLADSITIFLGGNHRLDWITTFPFGHLFKDEFGGMDIIGHPSTNGDVFIGNDVWIASNVTILSGVIIADGAVIAANSTVVKNVKHYEVVGGNPATHIKYRFTNEIISLLLKLRWWDLDTCDIKLIIKQLCSNPTVELINELYNKFRIKTG